MTYTRLASAVIYQAYKDAAGRGSASNLEKAQAQAFLLGTGDSQPYLRFWCEVGGLNMHAIQDKARKLWRKRVA